MIKESIFLQLALAVLLLTSARPLSQGRPGSWAPVQVLTQLFHPSGRGFNLYKFLNILSKDLWGV